MKSNLVAYITNILIQFIWLYYKIENMYLDYAFRRKEREKKQDTTVKDLF